jgi:PAS domain S-box-containing protein
MNDKGQTNSESKTEQALKYRLHFEDLVLKISTHFIDITLDQIDAAITQTLKEISLFCGTDNANIYTFSQDESTFRLTYYWSNERLCLTPSDHQNMASTDNPWWFNQIKAQKVIAIPSVRNLPDEAAHERQSLLQSKIEAMVDVPMVYQGKLVGTMGFYSTSDYRNWTDDEIALLRIVSQVLTNAMQRKYQEEALQKYAHIVSSSSDLLALIDSNYVFQAASNSYVDYFGLTRDQIIGKTVADIVGNEHFFKVIKPKADLCLCGQKVHFQSWITLSDGRKCYFDTRYSPHFYKGLKTIVGYVVSERDNTNQKQLEDQLRQAYKMEAIGTLAGGIAHDFNNILSAVLGYAEISQTMVAKDSALHDHMQQILDAGARARDLVKQILAFSRQTEQTVSPLQIKPIANEALKLLRASVPASIQIKQDFCFDGYVMADATQIYQIIMNLCTNAAYAMKDNGGILSVTLKEVDIDDGHAARHHDFKPGKYVQLAISDTGTGIAPKIIDRIFDPFFTTKPKGEGTGMGLSLVHGIVKSYQGAITVDSKQGGGSTFNVFIPVLEDRFETLTETGEMPIPRGSEHVLFVDDEPPLVEIGQRMLESLGYSVTPVIGSMDALQCFKKNPFQFDLVLTDYTMPTMRGDQLAAELLKIRQDIPIILATGFTDKITHQDITRLGIRTIILKPIVMAHVATTIRKVLDS